MPTTARESVEVSAYLAYSNASPSRSSHQCSCSAVSLERVTTIGMQAATRRRSSVKPKLYNTQH